MKVMLINGSPRNNGCTARALKEVADTLESEGIGTETVFVGNKPMTDCLACYRCRETGKCVIDDIVNEIVDKAKDCDGFVFGSPVYYAHPSTRLLTVMDRAFYSGGRHFAFKPAAAVLSARRAGCTASMDVINKHFTINNMPVVSSTYWNQVFGKDPEEVEQDEEGLQTMRTIGHNMAWLIKCIDLGKRNGVEHAAPQKVLTNFHR